MTAATSKRRESAADAGRRGQPLAGAGGRGRRRARASRRRRPPVRRHGLPGSSPPLFDPPHLLDADARLEAHSPTSCRCRSRASVIRFEPGSGRRIDRVAPRPSWRRHGVSFRRLFVAAWLSLCALRPGAVARRAGQAAAAGRGRSGPAGAHRRGAGAQSRPACGAVGHRAPRRPRRSGARALPDPMVSITYTNDGWAPSLGSMPMTTLGFMVSQALPYSGKRDLRADARREPGAPGRAGARAGPARARGRRAARLLRPAARARTPGADRRAARTVAADRGRGRAPATPSARAPSPTCCACRPR